ncbi:MAG TPA: DUF732 domain-containing protein [Pseudonocardia sp.]|nr:DUF732 domain-containing protein [Pseudonocardia sp.]
MWGRGRRGGRHAAPTGAARRSAGPERTPQKPSWSRDVPAGGRLGTGPGEPIAIIGGSAITVLAGRIRRQHTSADVESPTTELSLTLPAPRVEPSADRPTRGRRAGPVPEPKAEPVRSPIKAGSGACHEQPRRRRDRRRFPVTAVAVGVVVPAAALAGVLLGAQTGAVAPVPDSAPPTVQAQAAAPSTGLSTTAVHSDRATAYLAALRAADVPASRSGQPETEAADAICEQSGRGVPDAELARVLPAMLTDVDRKQARTVVELAQRYYCP